MRTLRTAAAYGIAAAAALTLAACGGGSTTTTTTAGASPAASPAPPAAHGSMNSAMHAKGGAMKGAMHAASITGTMAAQSASKQTGTVTVTPSGTGIQVAIAISNEPKGASEPAHIHMGTCAKLGGIYKPLSNVVGGKSTTTVAGVTVAALQKGTYAVNVHKSAAALGVYVSCANL